MTDTKYEAARSYKNEIRWYKIRRRDKTGNKRQREYTVIVLGQL